MDVPRKDFYTSAAYTEKQRQRTKAAWERGRFDFLLKREIRTCIRPGCSVSFEVWPSDPKKYCSSSCSAQVTNRDRGAFSLETRHKIADSLKGKRSPQRGLIKVPRVEIVCQNKECGKKLFIERWKKTRFCSNACSMHVIGGQPTSPKAARAKAGVRKDISDVIYFYSRWEANMARLFSHFGITWIHQPATFDLHGQRYTPDFYLPDYRLYIEVKNFLGSYSKERDEKFRNVYPEISLKLILKDEYLKLEELYATLIPHWEYRNSKFDAVCKSQTISVTS